MESLAYYPLPYMQFLSSSSFQRYIMSCWNVWAFYYWKPSRANRRPLPYIHDWDANLMMQSRGISKLFTLVCINNSFQRRPLQCKSLNLHNWLLPLTSTTTGTQDLFLSPAPQDHQHWVLDDKETVLTIFSIAIWSILILLTKWWFKCNEHIFF